MGKNYVVRFNYTLQKRPVDSDRIEAMISRIEKTLRQMGEREVSSKVLGEICHETERAYG